MYLHTCTCHIYVHMKKKEKKRVRCLQGQIEIIWPPKLPPHPRVRLSLWPGVVTPVTLFLRVDPGTSVISSRIPSSSKHSYAFGLFLFICFWGKMTKLLRAVVPPLPGNLLYVPALSPWDSRPPVSPAPGDPVLLASVGSPLVVCTQTHT